MPDVVNKRVNIYIDNGAAETALKGLQTQADKLTKAIAAGQAAGKSMVSEIKKLDSVKSSIAGVQDQIDKGLRPSFAQTQAQVTKLRNELKRMSEDAPGYAEKFKAFQEANNTFQGMQKKIGGVQQAMKSLASEIKGVAIGVVIGSTIQAAFEKVGSYFSGILSGASKVSDELADLRRVANLTADEAANLNGSLSKLDTRTSTGGLREIAIVAGKLGVAKDDLVAFTQATDQLVVSLGDELGNADQITTQLGKILNVFEGKVTAEELSKLGNSFVELANAGVATGGFIADFTQRVAGISKASNVSLGSTVGLAAGFEELGLRSESSATAFQKLISTIAADIPAAARFAGVEVNEFNKLFSTSPQEALIKYAEGLTKNKKSFSEVTASFADAGEEGARVVQTLQAIGQSGDFLRTKIDLGNKSIQETSAITEAFALKNTTLAAEMDKLGKKFNAFIASKGLQEFLINAVAGFSKFIDVLKALPKFIGDNAVAFGFLTASLLVYNAAMLKSLALMLLEKSGIKSLIISIFELTVAQNGAAIASTSWGLITAVLTGNFKKAAQEFKLLSLLIKTNPLGLLLAVVGGLVLAFDALSGSIRKASAAEQVRQKIQEKIIDNTAEEISKVQFLTNVINDNTISLGTRQKALEDLKAIAPGYLNGLTLENAAYEEGKQAIDRYIESLRLKAAIEATQGLRTENASKELKIKLAINEAEKQAANANDFVATAIRKVIIEKQAELKIIEDLNKANDAFQKGLLEKLSEGTLILKTPADVVNPKTTPGATVPKTTEEKKKKLKKDLQEIASEFSAFQFFIEGLRVTDELDDILAKSKQLFTGADAGGILEDIKRLQDLRNRDQIAGDQLDIINSRGRARLEANEKLLKDERDQALQAENLTQNERLLINEEYNKKIRDLHLEHWQAIVAQILEFSQQALSIADSFNQIASNRENAELNRDRKINDEKRKNLDRQLKGKVISQSQYNAEIDKLNNAQDKKEEEIKKKAFERSKRLELIQAGISGAQAILATLAKFGPPFPPNFLGIGAMALTVGTVVANLAAISSKKYATGGMLDGPGHSSGGMPVIDPRSGRKVAEVEGGEAILSRATVRNNPGLVSSLLHSSMHRGGQRISYPWESRSMQSIDFSRLTNSVRQVRKFESGGVFTNEDGSPANGFDTAIMLEMLIELRKPKRNYVLLQDVQDNSAQLQRIVDDARVSR